MKGSSGRQRAQEGTTDGVYGEKVTEHFRNPRHVGDMENPNGFGHVGNSLRVAIHSILEQEKASPLASANQSRRSLGREVQPSR